MCMDYDALQREQERRAKAEREQMLREFAEQESEAVIQETENMRDRK